MLAKQKKKKGEKKKKKADRGVSCDRAAYAAAA